jgi:hypothetical protein
MKNAITRSMLLRARLFEGMEGVLRSVAHNSLSGL